MQQLTASLRFRMYPDQRDKLDSIAQEKKLTPSKIAREGLNLIFKRYEKTEKD